MSDQNNNKTEKAQKNVTVIVWRRTCRCSDPEVWKIFLIGSVSSRGVVSPGPPVEPGEILAGVAPGVAKSTEVSLGRDHGNPAVGVCLLYTSPSPRDS